MIPQLQYSSNPSAHEADETTLLALARCGGAPFEQPNKQEFESIVSNINSRKARVYIPWFLTHERVNEFSEICKGAIDVESLYAVIRDIEARCARKVPHWVEKVNLFHLYGIFRILNIDPYESRSNMKENSASHIPLSILSARNSKLITFPLSILSARNSQLITSRAGALESVKSIDLMNKKNLFRFFAEYQLYYYGGFEQLVLTLSKYVGTEKESIIPLTIVSIRHTFSLNANANDFLNDNILSQMEPGVTKMIDYNAVKD